LFSGDIAVATTSALRHNMAVPTGANTACGLGHRGIDCAHYQYQQTVKTRAAPLPPLQSVKVLDQLRERFRYLRYSIRTEPAYVH